MDFRFYAHDPETGARLHRLPRPSNVNIGDTFGTRGTLELTYSSKALAAKPMPTFVEIRPEATFDEGLTWEPMGPNYLRLSGSHEDTDAAGMRTVKFVSREWLLGKARVGYGDLPLIDGKRPFYRASPGQIMRALLLEAKDRGAAQGIEIGGFTASADSSGQSWGKVATIYYQPGLPILSVLENLVEQGMCDYRMDGNTVMLYEPETTMGRDLATGDNPVRVHGSLTEAPVEYTLEDLTNSALLIGDDGFSLEVDNPTAPDDYGRLEVTIEQGGVSDAGTARIMVDESLQRGSREIREITRTQKAEGLKHLPYRDYRVGDYVQVRDLGEWQRYRVREIQAVRDGDGWTVHTVINDRLQELLLKLAKRTSGIVNGSTGSGGDGTQPAPPAKPGIEPAAPEGLVIDQQVYLDRQGVARGAVTAGWGAVTQSTRGEAIEIGGYELWWRENETLAVWRRASSVVDSLTVTHSPVVLSDTFGNAMEYQWRVRAVAEASARPGPWSDSITLTMTQDTTPPNMPSTPTVSTDLRIITVDIDGIDEFGESLPVDYNHHRIYFASSLNMADAVQVGTLSNPGSWNSGSMEPDVPVYVAVTAVDNVGNESPMTPGQGVTPKKLVDDDSIRDELGTIDDKIADAKQAAIDESVVTAGGVTVHNKTTTPVDSSSDKEHDVWQQWTTLEEGGTLVAAWLHDGTEWVKRSIVEEYIPRIHLAEGTFGTMSGGRLEANSVTADKVLVGSVNLMPNPRFFNDGAGWSHANIGATVIPYGGYDSGSFVRVPAESGQKLFWHGALSQTYRTMVGPDETYRVAVWVRSVDAPIPAGGAAITMRAYTEGAGQGGYVFPSPASFYNTAEIPANTWGRFEGALTIPDGRSYVAIGLAKQSDHGVFTMDFASPSFMKMSGATLIEDGAITTDKILANAITAGKIAALAIEADHISANAITADKIRAGAIDSMLITGARIRTAASGRRTELDVEGLKSYDSSGNTVLTTQTSDGSIDMRGILSQTISGVTLRVGVGWEGDYPGVQWSDSNIYNYPPGVGLKAVDGESSKKETVIQGPGVSTGNSYLSLKERGERFRLRTWKGDVSSPDDWIVEGNLTDNLMRIGSSTSDAPHMYFKRGSGDTGAAFVGYRHPNGVGYSSMALRDSYAYIGAHNWQGNLMGRLRMDASGTALNSGTRNMYLYGNEIGINADGGIWLNHNAIYMNSLPSDSGASEIGRVNGRIHSLYSSRKYKLMEEPIESTVDDFEGKLMSVDAKTWVDRTRADRIADHMTAIENGEKPTEPLEDIGGLERIPGIVAEDLHDAGLGLFVGYDNEGEPQSVLYSRIGPALIPIIRRLRDRVDALETKLGETA